VGIKLWRSHKVALSLFQKPLKALPNLLFQSCVTMPVAAVTTKQLLAISIV